MDTWIAVKNRGYTMAGKFAFNFPLNWRNFISKINFYNGQRCTAHVGYPVWER